MFCAGETIIKNTPFGRFGTAEELVGPLIMLASNAGSFCTGVRCYLLSTSSLQVFSLWTRLACSVHEL